MNEEGINIILFILGSIAIFVAIIFYNSRPDLHNCYSCGKYLTVNAHRYWYKVNGKDVPYCAKCNRKRR
jgi:hypothetical protein